MITLQEPLIDIIIKIEMDLPQSKILEFLAQKGYNIEVYRQYHPPVDEMLVSEPEIMKYTFCAIKDDEKPSWENQYLKVFEREAKKTLKVFMKI